MLYGLSGAFSLNTVIRLLREVINNLPEAQQDPYQVCYRLGGLSEIILHSLLLGIL